LKKKSPNIWNHKIEKKKTPVYGYLTLLQTFWEFHKFD
jgi:hypothetical protein